jgi:hypothetical protein
MRFTGNMKGLGHGIEKVFFSCEWIVLALVHKNLLLLVKLTYTLDRVGIFNLLRSPGIDFTESIPPANVAWRAGTTIPYLLGS